MKPRDAVIQQSAAKVRADLGAELAHRLVVVGEELEPPVQVGGELGPAQLREALDLLGAQEGQDAGHDGNSNAPAMAQVVLEFQKVLGLVEELGEEEFCTGLDFGRSMVPVKSFVRRFDVAFGIPGGPHGEVVSAADKAHELDGVRKSAGYRLKLALSSRRIAAESQDVFDPEGMSLVQNFREHVARAADAGDVGHRLDREVAANAINDTQGAIAGASGGPVGDGHERRTESRQRRQSFIEERSLRLFRLGGKSSKEMVGRSCAYRSGIRKVDHLQECG